MCENITPNPNKKENFFSNNYGWKSLAAVVYLMICFVDFALMPILTYFFQTPPISILPILHNVDPDIQKILLTHIYSQWKPITENSGGLFHIVFLTILGIISWKDGNKEIENLKQEAKKQNPINTQK